MKPASARGSFGEVPGNQAWCGGGIQGSHRRPGVVPCVVASGVSKTTAGSPPPPTSLCPKAVSLNDDNVRVGLGRTASCGKRVAPGSWLAGACAGKGLRV